MRYQDYRSNVQDILDNIKSDQNSLNLGAVAILSVLDMAMLNKDEEELEDTEGDYENEEKESASNPSKEIDESHLEKETNEDDGGQELEKTQPVKENEQQELPKLNKAEKATKPKKIKTVPKVKTIEEEYGVEPGNKAVIAEIGRASCRERV